LWVKTAVTQAPLGPKWVHSKPALTRLKLRRTEWRGTLDIVTLLLRLRYFRLIQPLDLQRSLW